ncbi:Asp23/Gls24 family envelope stress response protein [Arthrobacter sp. ZGTC412]|uniref:Asp23/Gls24 family envelope stress response protein n=1 Tax=Arthrobacter sp. ZGTC412 TaxID=2058900 RepID=UPI001C67184A|nr:Asp23/Gls24 family envelope stress response protein [Arthrobacter sp. ZGTC412]
MARTSLQRLSEATRSLREQDLNDPALKPRPGITNAIMDVARAEIRRSKRIILGSTEEGTTEISEQALSALIRLAATAIPGVHSRRCHIEVRSSDPSPAGEDPRSRGTADAGPHLIINLRVAAAAGIDIPRTVQTLRQEISSAIPAGAGIRAEIINITVEDLYDV